MNKSKFDWGFFYKLFKNIARIYERRNLFWQIVFILLTYILVTTGFDWFYFQVTRSALIHSILFPAVLFGLFVPIFLPIVLLLYYFFTKNKKILNTAYAVIQAALLGLGISSFYKVFTGRVGLPHVLNGIDTSHIFKFGFLRGGAFQGWPSSHTAVAFAVSVAIFILFPKNKIVRYAALAYALYIGIGVSVSIHWFSDFVAGAILGTIIGISVGKSFLERLKNKNIIQQQ